MARVNLRARKKDTGEPRKHPSENAKWNDEYLVQIYELAKSGETDDVIAATLNTCISTFQQWTRSKPQVKIMLAKGRAACVRRRTKNTGAKAFRNYLYDRLPKHLQRLWREIEICNDDPDESSGSIRLEALMSRMGDRARQQLFFHAFTTNSFRLLAACKMVGISPMVIERWAEDPEFLELYDRIIELKKDFFEDALLELVHDKNPAAIIYANKAQNVARGYGEKQQIDHKHSGTVNQNVTVLDISKLGLSLEVQKEILAKIRAQQQGALPEPAAENVLNAEFKEAELMELLRKDGPPLPPLEPLE